MTSSSPRRRAPAAIPGQLALFDAEEASASPDAVATGRAAQVTPPPEVAPPVALAPCAPPPAASTPALAAPTESLASVLAPTAFRHPQAEREIRLHGGHVVAYAFRRARRRSIGFLVGPEGLSVSAPRWVGLHDVELALHEKAAWILRKLREQHERTQRLESARVDWRDGATLPFLGRDVVIVLDARTTGVLLQADDGAGLPGVPRQMLRVGLPHDATRAQIRDAVQSWLQRQARRLFEERCQFYAQRLGVRCRRLALSSAQTRWGSASADGSIRLNWRLIHFAMSTIDYVVAHELAHLREMNHSPRFWDVVRSVLPDYQRSRDALKNGIVPSLD